jgi:hypothetical protein
LRSSGFWGASVACLAKAKKRAQSTNCISNLKQVGLSLQMYVDDNDHGCLVLWAGARASYDKNSSDELIFYIANTSATQRLRRTR